MTSKDTLNPETASNITVSTVDVPPSLKLSHTPSGCDNETFEVALGCKRSLDPTVALGCKRSLDPTVYHLRHDISNYFKDMELSLKEEELAITNIQKKLMQVKYDLLKYQYSSMEVSHTKLKAKLEAYICSICMTNYKNCILEPCGHFVCCSDCMIMLPDSLCPLCRTRCDYYTKVFNC